MSKTILQKAVAFFMTNAGFSYNPKTETKRQGRKRCAESLAVAERDAASKGLTFEWRPDKYEEPGNFCCLCRSQSGELLSSLGGIDTDENPYRRVIQAELAREALDTLYKMEG